jgi:hydroxyethylthiazole kinase
MSSSINKRAGEMLAGVRSSNPVVHSITNYVVMNSTANVLLAVGAAPIMAHASEELDEITSIASSVVLNIGTLSKSWIESMIMAGRFAKSKSKPLVLDPVGAGATKLRTDTANMIINSSTPSVMRGNASEILSLSASGGKTRGVDSVHASKDALEAAKHIAESRGTVVAVTGVTDYITDGRNSYKVSNGHELLSKVTGTGCAATVVIGAFLAVEKDSALAAAAALAYFGLAGEIAAKKAKGPGSFWIEVVDALYNITPEDLLKGARIESI